MAPLARIRLGGLLLFANWHTNDRIIISSYFFFVTRHARSFGALTFELRGRPGFEGQACDDRHDLMTPTLTLRYDLSLFPSALVGISPRMKSAHRFASPNLNPSFAEREERSRHT